MFIPFLEYLIFSPYLIVDDVVIVFAFDIVQDIDPEYNMPSRVFHVASCEPSFETDFRAGCRSSWQGEVAPGRCGTYQLSKSVISLAIFEDSFLAHDYKVVKYTN